MELIPDDLITFAQIAYANHDKAHNYQHAVQVYLNARCIIQKEGLILTNEEWHELPYIMIGHDFRDHKLLSRGLCLSEIEIFNFYVSKLGVAAAIRIQHLHETCSWSNRMNNKTTTQMRKILQDADWIEAINVDRCIEYTRFILPDADESIIKDNVRKHIKDKLLLIRDELNYESSKKIVDERKLMEPLHNFM